MFVLYCDQNLKSLVLISNDLYPFFNCVCMCVYNKIMLTFKKNTDSIIVSIFLKNTDCIILVWHSAFVFLNSQKCALYFSLKKGYLCTEFLTHWRSLGANDNLKEKYCENFSSWIYFKEWFFNKFLLTIILNVVYYFPYISKLNFS